MNKLFKTVAIPLFSLFTGAVLLPSARAFDAEKAQTSSVRIVSILDGNNIASATGFVINENGNIVTNQQIVNGATQIFALQHIGGATRLYRCKCDASRQSKELNLAVLTSSMKASPLVMSTAEPKPASSVYAAGFPGIFDASHEGIGAAFLTVVLQKWDNPALDAEGVDITREISANQRLQDSVSPSLSVGMVRRIVSQPLETGSLRVTALDCDLNIGHGYGGGPLLDESGFVIGVVGPGISASGIAQVHGGIAASELEKFLTECKISFRQTTSGKP